MSILERDARRVHVDIECLGRASGAPRVGFGPRLFWRTPK
jgi:hypothetical protein